MILIHYFFSYEIIYRQVFYLRHIIAYKLTSPTIILPTSLHGRRTVFTDKRTIDELYADKLTYNHLRSPRMLKQWQLNVQKCIKSPSHFLFNPSKTSKLQNLSSILLK